MLFTFKKVTNIIIWFVILCFLTLAAENSASWHYCLVRWYVFLVAILGGWGLDPLPSRKQFKLVATTQSIFKSRLD
jgi:hypothetical protein